MDALEIMDNPVKTDLMEMMGNQENKGNLV